MSLETIHEREAHEKRKRDLKASTASFEETQKRKRGRPPGSKSSPRPRPPDDAAAFAYFLLTRDQIAERFGISPITVSKLYAKWGLRPVRICGRVLFPSDQRSNAG